MVRAERGLDRVFRRLPGTKILLTNAPTMYARDVVRHIGLHRHFAEHVPIESMIVHRQLRPKPSRPMLRQLLARRGLRARDCILVEDTLANLKSAKSLGMRTVWFTRYLRGVTHRPEFVDVTVKSLGRLPRNLHRLR
jgi:putative hydrolase of the HAD superfamily